MAGGHSHPLYLDHDSPVHRLSPEVKVAASILFTVMVVATPPTEFWAFGCYLGIVVVVAAAARVPAGWLATRSMIELPFVLLAVLLPLLGPPPDMVWLGVSLSIEGLIGAFNILAKGTLGVLSSLLLAATTQQRDLILGLQRLRTPAVVTQIATFMMRYVEVLVAEAKRMWIARLSRGYRPRFLWQAYAIAAGAGSLFLRSYERGERVYLAMVSRGYAGAMPPMYGPGATEKEWAVALTVPAVAGVIWLVALLRAGGLL